MREAIHEQVPPGGDVDLQDIGERRKTVTEDHGLISVYLSDIRSFWVRIEAANLEQMRLVFPPPSLACLYGIVSRPFLDAPEMR